MFRESACAQAVFLFEPPENGAVADRAFVKAAVGCGHVAEACLVEREVSDASGSKERHGQQSRGGEPGAPGPERVDARQRHAHIERSGKMWPRMDTERSDEGKAHERRPCHPSLAKRVNPDQ